MKRNEWMEDELILVYKLENEQTNVYTTKNNDNLYFQSTNPVLNSVFESNDYSEAVATLMRIRGIFTDRDFWNISLKNKYSVDVEKTLYWLTGGDKEWQINNNYKYKWEEVKSMFIDEYGDIILNIIKNSSKLIHIRNGFLNELNLPKMYEFALKHKLIN